MVVFDILNSEFRDIDPVLFGGLPDAPLRPNQYRNDESAFRCILRTFEGHEIAGMDHRGRYRIKLVEYLEQRFVADLVAPSHLAGLS